MIPPNSQIDTKWVTVDEVAKSAGLFTSGVSANGYITPKRGFGEKWDKLPQPHPRGRRPARRGHPRQGGRIDRGAQGARGSSIWAPSTRTCRGAPSSRGCPSTTRDRTAAASRSRPRARTWAVSATGKIKVTERDIKRIVALYDSNVSLPGRAARATCSTSWPSGASADDTMLIVTADHGDEQWEDGRVGHGGRRARDAGSRAAAHPLPAAVPGRQGQPRAPRRRHRADGRRRARPRAGRELAGRVAHRAGPGPGPRLPAPVDGVEVRERPRRAPRALEGVQRRRLEVASSTTW